MSWATWSNAKKLLHVIAASSAALALFAASVPGDGVWLHVAVIAGATAAVTTAAGGAID